MTSDDLYIAVLRMGHALNPWKYTSGHEGGLVWREHEWLWYCHRSFYCCICTCLLFAM